MPSTVIAGEVVRASRDEARRLGSPIVGQEHVLLAIGDRPDCLAAQALAGVGLVARDLRAHLLVGITPRPPSADDPEPTPRLRRAMDEARHEARERGRATTSADLIVGMLRSHAGVGFQMLSYTGISEASLRSALDPLVPEAAELEDIEAAEVTDYLR